AMAHLSNDGTNRASQTAALRQELLKTAGSGIQLEVANSIWAPDSHAFLPAFAKLANEQFGASPHVLPNRDPVSSAALVNRWIRDKTRGRIGSLVGPASFDPTGPTVLAVNAVYLKATWEERFDLAKTKPRVFTQGSGNTSMLPTMLQTSLFEYSDSEAWQCLEMRFKGAEFAMRFLLPRAEAGRMAIEAAMSPAAWDKVVQTSTNCGVNVMLPRFGFSTQLDLKGLWQTLGARDVFDAQKADLTAMVSQTPCWAGQVVHEATIEVNEIGAEASAATAAPAAPFGDAPPAHRMVSFIANRPFLWVIQHRRTGLILFMGRFAGE
ncbi:MAG: hypothetical protein JNG86_05920, partial [Verrucomicrobiaceae bacterium]|nr:hypothetical protein [Verrucomicrobiaceae bacterium]